MPGKRLKCLCLFKGNAFSHRLAHDGLSKRVFRALFR